ncbi:unnamed protein product [Cylindrotheca closterium]|uniref:N-acetyltransferase domain-containing protein n=1 Tax=Cylindrotheca closterium TaxID=2856 RepID=A0AAD2JP73_9STRA|nr:unnamed protein product [Cylindrotheca closterium]
MKARKRPRPAFQGHTICEVSTETPQKQLSIRSFFGQKQVSNIQVTPRTPLPCSRPLETPPTAEVTVQDTPPSSDESPVKDINVTSNNTNTIRNKNDNKNKKRRLAQVFIDCGQKNFGQVVCPQCGTLYVPGIAEDEKMHKQVCEQISQGVAWGSTANCKIINRNSHAKSSIVQIRPSEITKHRSRLEKILRIVEKDLGMHANSSNVMITTNGGTIFLYLQDQKVVGYLAVNSISTAYRMLNLYERDTKPMSCMLGVAVLWTHPRARKQGIAIKLVDAARENAVFGIVVAKSKLAFSSPTEAGWRFAKNYCGNDEPLFYEF